MKYLKENILSDIKQQFFEVDKANGCSQLLIDSLKDQINSLQNKIQFVREEVKVKNQLLELTITSKKFVSSTTYPSSQQIRHHTKKISEEKKCCSININGNNNVTIKPLTQKDGVEISLESINNNDIAKNNAREERAIVTNNTKINKNMCDTQNNIYVDHIKNDVKKVNGNQLYHNFSKDARQRNDSQFNACTKNASNNGDNQQQQEKLSRPPRKFAFIVGDSMINKDGYLLASSINYEYIVKVRRFVTAKTDNIYDHEKPMQRNSHPNVYISHVGTNDLLTDMTSEEISENFLLFLNI